MRTASIVEGVRLAIDQLRAEKFRSTLTILGVVVGVATVMIMSAMVAGIRSSITTAVAAAGPQNFVLSRFDFNAVRVSVGSERPPWADNPKITPADARQVARLDKVQQTVVRLSFTGSMTAGRQHVSGVQIAGEGVGWSAFTQGTFTAGRDFLPAEVEAARPVVVLSKALADQLFGALNPIGQTLRIGGQAFRVTATFEPAENIFASLVKNFAIVPYTAALKYLHVNDDFLSALVVTAPNATQADAMDEVVTLMRQRHGLRAGQANDFVVIRQEELLKTFNRITGIFFMVMIALSSVALLVGGVGVVAIMMIAVTERTREIGIRKAIGATPREILWQFLVEAATLTVIGSAIGMIIGGSLAFAVSALTPIPASVPVGAVIGALLMAAVAGILCGLWPAWRAARMDPVVALRFE
jgi:putative ABC transport system permease protein